MSDEEFKSDYPSTETLDRLKKAAIFYFASGLILAVVQVLFRPMILTIIAGAIICFIGTGWFLANNPVNKKTGALIIAVGIVVALSKTPLKLLTVVMGTLLSIIIIGSLAMGAKYLFTYLVALNKK
jgi:hypothetical protein